MCGGRTRTGLKTCPYGGIASNFHDRGGLRGSSSTTSDDRRDARASRARATCGASCPDDGRVVGGGPEKTNNRAPRGLCCLLSAVVGDATVHRRATMRLRRRRPFVLEVVAHRRFAGGVAAGGALLPGAARTDRARWRRAAVALHPLRQELLVAISRDRWTGVRDRAAALPSVGFLCQLHLMHKQNRPQRATCRSQYRQVWRRKRGEMSLARASGFLALDSL